MKRLLTLASFAAMALWLSGCHGKSPDPSNSGSEDSYTRAIRQEASSSSQTSSPKSVSGFQAPTSPETKSPVAL